MTARIHNTDKETYYVVNNASQCNDATEKSAYEMAEMLNDTIQMGIVVVEPQRFWK